MEIQSRNYGSIKESGCLADSGNAKEFLKGTLGYPWRYNNDLLWHSCASGRNRRHKRNRLIVLLLFTWKTKTSVECIYFNHNEDQRRFLQWKKKKSSNIIVFIILIQHFQLGDCSLNSQSLHPTSNKSCKMSTFVYHSVFKYVLVFFLLYITMHVLQLSDLMIIKQYNHRTICLVWWIFHVTVLFLVLVHLLTSSAVDKDLQMKVRILQQK